MFELNVSGLLPHQVKHAPEIARCLYANGGALDASDTGTGKAYIGAWIARTFKTAPLVICPLGVKNDWATAMRFMGAEAEIVNYERARGWKKKDEKYSSSQWGFEKGVGQGSQWIWRQNYELMILDESDRCNGETSLNSKMLIAAKRQARWVLMMTATPAEDPRQMKALGFALGLFKLPDFRYWLMAHGCRPSKWGGFDFMGLSKNPKTAAKGKQAMLKIHDQIFNQGRGARMRKAEIPGFPKSRVELKMIEDETGVAKEKSEELAEIFEGRDLERINALRQELELLKVPHLVDLAEHYAKSSRVIIFVNYKRTIEALRSDIIRLFGIAPVIDGSVTGEEREKIKRDAQANLIPCLICNSQAGGIGIGLHDPKGQVDRTDLISPCYSARILEQVFGRTVRVGAAFSLQLLLGFAGTLEAEIASVVLAKRGNLLALNDAVLNGHIPA